MTDAELLSLFETCALPPDLFDHRLHVRVAWCYLREEQQVLPALSRFTASLKRYAGNLGKLSIYHETITWAYLFLIHERMQRAPVTDFDTFAAQNRDLLEKPPVLERYYRPETLSSDLARRVFVMPDLA
jgi:hypothetical protein